MSLGSGERHVLAVREGERTWSEWSWIPTDTGQCWDNTCTRQGGSEDPKSGEGRGGVYQGACHHCLERLEDREVGDGRSSEIWLLPWED